MSTRHYLFIFCLFLALSVFPVEAQTLFGINYHGYVISIDPTTGVSELVGPSGFDKTNCAASDSDGRLFSVSKEQVDGGVDKNTIILIDPDTGVGSEFISIDSGTMDGGVTGLAIDPTDSQLTKFIAAWSQGGDTNADLVSIDANTGVLTIIGDMGVNRVTSLAFDSSGNLFCMDIGTPSINVPATFRSVNLDTGDTTEIGVIDASFFDDLQALEYDLKTQTMYAGRERLLTIDTTSGEAEYVGISYLASREIRGLFFGPTPSVFEVSIDVSTQTGASGIPVTIFGAETFDVSEVKRNTLVFGPNNASPNESKGGVYKKKVNDDQYKDLVSHYRPKDTGIGLDDTEACISGTTKSGMPFRGCDDIDVECKIKVL